MNFKKIVKLLTAFSMFAVLLVGCGDDNADEGEKVYRDYQLSEVKTLDFNKATDAVSGRVGFNVDERLVLIDKDGKVKPGIAESWEISDDGLEYTFMLRDQNYVNHEGKEEREITADDFKNAFDYIVKKDDKGEYITQSAAYITKYVSVSEVEVIDDKTLVIKLDKAYDYALSMFAGYVFAPRPQDLIDELGGDDKYGVDETARWYTGPFYIKSFESSSKIVMMKNDTYWDSENVELDKVETKIMVGADSTAVESAYNEGQVDYFRLDGDLYDKYEEDENAALIDEFVVFNLVFNFNPTDANSDMHYFADNIEGRKALAMAYDPQYLVDEIYRAGYASSYWVPKGFDLDGDDDFRASTGEYEDGYIGYDVEEAKKQWEEFKKKTGKDEFTVKILNYDNATATDAMAYVKQEWEKNLDGLTVVIEPLVFQNKLDKAKKGDFDINFYGWSPDYISSKAMLTNFESDSPYNEISFNNSEYDKLLKSGTREDLIKAEEILLKDEVAMAAGYQRSRPYVIREGVTGMDMYPIATDFDYRVIDVK